MSQEVESGKKVTLGPCWEERKGSEEPRPCFYVRACLHARGHSTFWPAGGGAALVSPGALSGPPGRAADERWLRVQSCEEGGTGEGALRARRPGSPCCHQFLGEPEGNHQDSTCFGFLTVKGVGGGGWRRPFHKDFVEIKLDQWFSDLSAH